MSNLFAELKRRKVFRVGAAYLVVAWLLLQVADLLVPILDLPDWTSKLVFLLLVIGFFPALILAWAFELTPEGIRPEGKAATSQGDAGSKSQALHYSIIGFLIIFFAASAGFWFMGGDERWARNEAIPQIEKFIDAGDREAAYLLAMQVERVLPNHPELAELWDSFSWITSIPSDPPGATVFRRAYADTEAEWENLGKTPLHDIRIPFGLSLIRLELDERPPLLRALGGGLISKKRLEVEESPWAGFANVNPERYIIDSKDTLPDGMVRVPGWAEESGDGETEFSDFFIGRHEVTNSEFKEFVDAGGYRRRDLWEYDFSQNKEATTWEEAIALFKDQTGRPGPANWVGGAYPDGASELPVAGVSWYEAAAFARFAGKELPTIHHWRRAYAVGMLGWMLPASNIEGSAPANVGEFQGVGWTGTYDMVGNAREWCLNETGTQRIILGGGWNDANYVATESVADANSMPPLDRSETNGFRLAVTNDESPAANFAKLAIPEPVDDVLAKPVTDEVFSSLISIYDYDRTPLNATVEAAEIERYWTRERISIDAAYGDERLTIFLYLPNNESSRHQAIAFWPGITGFYVESIDQSPFLLDFAVRNGRAVAFPVYNGTYERRQPQPPDWSTIAGRDLAVQQVKDLRRTLDYLETRADIDTKTLAYYGRSWGGRFGAVALAVEPRLRVGVLDQAGILFGVIPEIDVVNYLSRVKVPVLQFNGLFDTDFRYQTSAKPFFDLLGTAPADKKHVVEPTGHFVPPAIVIGETLSWLDEYAGPAIQ